MVYIFLADGFEECEALIPLDILRRADVTTQTVGVTGEAVTGSHGIKVVCDKTIADIEFASDIEAVILPGGMPGTLNLKGCKKLEDIVLKAADANILTAAICAAPLILGNLGLLKGKEAICYPGFEDELIGAKISQNSVVRDGKIITAKGVGAAFDFGFEILSALGHSTENLKKSMIYRV